MGLLNSELVEAAGIEPAVHFPKWRNLKSNFQEISFGNRLETVWKPFFNGDGSMRMFEPPAPPSKRSYLKEELSSQNPNRILSRGIYTLLVLLDLINSS
jgi:hypothetical protein